MSKYSAQMNGKVLDFKFKKHQTFENHRKGGFHHSYTFWLYNSPTEEYYVGIISRGSRGEWSAMSALRENVPNGFALVHGFASRLGAVDYLLQINDDELRKLTK